MSGGYIALLVNISLMACATVVSFYSLLRYSNANDHEPLHQPTKEILDAVSLRVSEVSCRET